MLYSSDPVSPFSDLQHWYGNSRASSSQHAMSLVEAAMAAHSLGPEQPRSSSLAPGTATAMSLSFTSGLPPAQPARPARLTSSVSSPALNIQPSSGSTSSAVGNRAGVSVASAGSSAAVQSSTSSASNSAGVPPFSSSADIFQSLRFSNFMAEAEVFSTDSSWNTNIGSDRNNTGELNASSATGNASRTATRAAQPVSRSGHAAAGPPSPTSAHVTSGDARRDHDVISSSSTTASSSSDAQPLLQGTSAVPQYLWTRTHRQRLYDAPAAAAGVVPASLLNFSARLTQAQSPPANDDAAVRPQNDAERDHHRLSLWNRTVTAADSGTAASAGVGSSVRRPSSDQLSVDRDHSSSYTVSDARPSTASAPMPSTTSLFLPPFAAVTTALYGDQDDATPPMESEPAAPTRSVYLAGPRPPRRQYHPTEDASTASGAAVAGSPARVAYGATDLRGAFAGLRSGVRDSSSSTGSAGLSAGAPSQSRVPQAQQQHDCSVQQLPQQTQQRHLAELSRSFEAFHEWLMPR